MCIPVILIDPFILLFLTLSLCVLAWGGDRLLTTDKDQKAARSARREERLQQMRRRNR